jgi:hypothetical protein
LRANTFQCVTSRSTPICVPIVVKK